MLTFETKPEGQRYTFNDLYRLIELLRSPGGCPWDAKQTHTTLIKPMIEEAYEVVDAIQKDSDEKLCEELGDVLLQVIFHCIIASEDGSFEFDDVTDTCTRKMLFRHSHIFGDDKADTAEQVVSNWDKRKREEKGFKSLDEELRDIPSCLPALMRAAKVANKIKASAEGTEYVGNEAAPQNMTDEERRSYEIGRELYETVSKAARLGVESEAALNMYIEKGIIHEN